MILDANGNPIDRKVLKAAQTADAVQLRREFADHPSKGMTPQKLADILQRAEQGDLIAQAEFFQDMEEKDGHIQAEMHKRKMAVQGLDWWLEPRRDASAREKKQTENLEARIRDMLDVEDLIFDALDAIGHGYARLELEWEKDNLGWFPKVNYRDPRWFTFDADWPNVLRLRDSSQVYGTPLTPFGWIEHNHKSRSGILPRSGLHRCLAWPFLFKNYSVRDLAELLEIYGLPIRVGKYGPNATDDDKRTLMSAIVNMGHHAGGIIPESMMIDFITATSSANSDPFRAMIEWCEGTVSKAILGGTLTTQTGANGNRSLGDVHNEVRLDIRNNDARQLATSLTNYLVYPVCMLNELFADNRCPVWMFDTQEPDDLALYADALPKLVSVGAKIPANWINKRLKIPEAEADEELLAPVKSEPGPAFGNDQNVAVSQDKTALAAEVEADVDPSPVASHSDQLTRDAGDSVKSMIDTIRAKVDSAESLEALRDDLLNSYGDIDSAQLVKVMELAFLTADLAGRFDVNEGG